MRTSLTVGRISGIPIRIHLNWVFTAVLVVWSLASGYFPQEYPRWEPVKYWTLASVTAMLFFFSILLHELGHAMLSLRESVPVNSITLFIFGGVAHIANEPETPGAEFRIVIAGPLTSLLLAGVFGLFSWLGTASPELQAASGYLSRVNLILALFNMIPGFPLDGGRVLRSFLWKTLDDFHRATRWACNIGLGIAILFIVGGGGLMLLGQFMSGLWIAFIGWYLGAATQEGYRQARTNEAELQKPEIKPLPEKVALDWPPPHLRSGTQFALAQAAERAETAWISKRILTRQAEEELKD